MSEVVLKDTLAILGIKSAKNAPIRSNLEFAPVVRQGLPVSTVRAVSKEMALSMLSTIESIGLPKRTIMRRLKDNERLNPDESERVARFARVLAQATEAFGDREKARRWLQKENRALGGEIPLHLLTTEVGGSVVLEELGRIENGVFA